jgi:hypothetical protein
MEAKLVKCDEKCVLAAERVVSELRTGVLWLVVR